MELQPSVTTPTIPPEIWLLVAQFIPHIDLCSMFRINRVFFQLSMNAIYRELAFGADSDPEALWRLQRVRDPSIAHRVCHLRIDLSYDDQFFKQYDWEGNLNPGWTDISLLDGIQIMAETVTFLTNVKEFSVKWEGFPSREHVIPFLDVAWKSFGSGLRKLSFGVALKDLAALSAADGLVALKDLDVKVSSKGFGDDRHGEPLCMALAPFVNKVGPTLRSLSYFSTFYHLDPSPFFDRLDKIPNLERLCLYVNNYLDILAEPFAATRFLCDHATTLRHLDWDEGHGREDREYMMDLGSANLEGVFSDLCTLRIRVPSGAFAMGLQRIRCSAQTLTSLGLSGYDMTYEEVNIVISLFTPHSARHFKELGLRVTFISPELILLLMQTFPRLEKLAIHFTCAKGREAGTGTSETTSAENDENSVQEERLNAGIFAHTLRGYDMGDWALRDIDFKKTIGTEFLVEKLMWLLAECVPSLQTFGGEDKELHAISRHERL